MSMRGATIRRHLGGWYSAAARELSLLAALLVLAGSVLAFGNIAAEVLEGDTRGFDRTVMLALRDPADPTDPIGPCWFEEAARDITSLGSFAVLLLVSAATIGFLVMVEKRGAALLVLASVGGGALLSTLLKLGFERPRPGVVPHATEVFTASFPSAHATLSAVTYLTLGALLTRVQPRRRVKAYALAIALLLTLLVGASRVYLGVHWPSDVLAGWCVGSAWAILCWLIAHRLQREGQVERDIPATDGADPDRPAPSG